MADYSRESSRSSSRIGPDLLTDREAKGHVILTGSRTSLSTIGSRKSEGQPTNWKWRVRLYMTMLAIFSATGGFLFGYDTGVVSGAMIKIDKYFHLSPLWHELIVASTIGAAAIAAALGGLLCEWLGRKPVLLIASAIFTIGAAVMAGSPVKYVLLSGRIIVGAGIGLAAMVVPMYIAESAPADMRGKLVVLNNLFITGGQFVATLIDGAFSEVNQGWRYMLGLAAIPSIIMFIGFIFMPESPRWLVFHGKMAKANTVLHKLRDPSKVADEMGSINKDLEEYRRYHLGCFALIKKFMTSRTVLLALYVGCGLQMFQQLGGINTVMYYSASIIQMAGFNDNNAIWLSIIPAFGNFLFTIAGLLLVDRLGRRKLLIGSLAGIVIGFLLLTGSFIASNETSPVATPYKGYNDSITKCDYTRCGECVGNSHCGFCYEYINTTSGYYSNGTCSSGTSSHSDHTLRLDNDTTSRCLLADDSLSPDVETKWSYNSCPDEKFAWLTIISLFIYIMFFAPGMGPLPWTVNSEIYPNWARSTCIAIATAVNWIFNLIVSLTFLTLADALGQPKTFGLYAGLSFIGLLFAILFVPETKGTTLENVEQLFRRPHFMSWCRRRDNNQSIQSDDKRPLLK